MPLGPATIPVTPPVGRVSDVAGTILGARVTGVTLAAESVLLKTYIDWLSIPTATSTAPPERVTPNGFRRASVDVSTTYGFRVVSVLPARMINRRPSGLKTAFAGLPEIA